MWKSSVPALPVGADQLAGIDVARGDHAVEGRIDLLERLQFVSRCTLACADLTAEAVAAAWLTKVSVSCCETALDLTRSE